MFETGYLRLFRWRGVPVRLHWTLPLGALLFGQFRFVPAFWGGFVLLVFLHEFGHALMVRRLGHYVTAIDITGFGGMCRWTGPATNLHRSLIAWGGVIAQALLFAAAMTAVMVWPRLGMGWPGQLTSVFLWTNVWLAALNLIPFPPFDGAQAWRLFPELRRPGAWQMLRRALLPTQPRRPAVGPSTPPADQHRWSVRPKAASSRSYNPPAVPAAGGKKSPQELADLLKHLSEQARDARKSDKYRWN